MKTLVERIRNRELAIENDGILEELRKAVKHCFPDDKDLCGGGFKFYCAYKPDTNNWDFDNETDLPTVSVKEVLAEIEGECKQTKVIYLNEDDRPKIEESLGLVNWFDKYSQEDAGWHRQNYYTQNQYAEKWLEYRNNFKPNNKPIEFEKVYILSENDYQLCDNPPSNMDLVIVVDKNTFIGIKTNEEYAQWRFKGNLNNGKVN